MLDKETMADLRRLVRFLDKHALSEVEVEKGGARLRLHRAPAPGALPLHLPAAAPGAGTSGSHQAVATEGARKVVSPFVGTFYASPSPQDGPFVRVGSEVEKGQILCIIEAMKLMNEIVAPVAGRIEQVLAENGQSVEYGQELFVLVPRP